jgi:hypothetical protein
MSEVVDGMQLAKDLEAKRKATLVAVWHEVQRIKNGRRWTPSANVALQSVLNAIDEMREEDMGHE